MNKKLIFFLIILLLLITTYLLKHYYERNNIIYITNENYPSILDDAHKNIDKYINKSIIVEGYIFRREDFNKDNFVIAKDMYISPIESVVIGFLCHSNSMKKYKDYQIIKLKGIIKKGYFNNIEYPILEVKRIWN